MRAAGLVIHWLAPLGSAVRPSREMATFARTRGPAALHAREESEVGLAGLVREQADVDLDPRRAAITDALAGDERVGIADRDHHALQGRRRSARRNERRAAVVRGTVPKET